MSDPDFAFPDDLLKFVDLSSLEMQFSEEGGPERVERLLKAAIFEYPEHGVPMAAWAWYLSKNEDYAGAIAWLDRAVKAGPQAFVVQWRTRRAGYRFRAGDWRSGFHDFADTIASAPDDAVPHLARSFEMRLMGDHVSGDLEEKAAMILMGQLETASLFVYLRQHVSFAFPESLEATLFVLTDPLDPVARIHRGEIFSNLGAPTAAFYDLHFANVLKPNHLGVMARLEDLRMKGILADSPLYEVKKPDYPLMPIYSKILSDYVQFLDRIVIPPRRGVSIGIIEKLFGRVSDQKPFDLKSSSWNMVVTGNAVCLSAVCLIGAAVIVADLIDDRKADLFGTSFQGALAVLWGIEGVVLGVVILALMGGATIAAAGTLQLILRCRTAEMSGLLMACRWYVRLFVIYPFILFASFLILLMIGFNLFAFGLLVESIRAAYAMIQESAR